MNIATEFNEFKDILFKKKIMRHEMRRIQKKKSIDLEHTKSTKYHYRVLMVNDTFKMIALIHLHIFTKTFTKLLSVKIQSQVKAHSQVNTNSQTNKTNTN